MSGVGEGHRPVRLLLTGGGTGGHLFPAIAAAEAVRIREPRARILFIGTRRRLDQEQLRRSGFAVQTVRSYGLKGKRLVALLKALAVMPLSLIEAVWRVARFRPDVVCGVGGYVTGPVVTAAWLLRIPTIIHEQNSIPGLANRLLGRLVDRVCISLPESSAYFPDTKTVLTGNPVRQAIRDTGVQRSKVAAGQQNTKSTLLVLGGSQGAHAINELVPDALAGQTGTVRVIHQTGQADEEAVRQRYQSIGVEAEVAAFFNDMAAIYRQADLVVSRAGATTLAEIAVVGLPAVLIPFPHAADDHQFHNGTYYAEQGGAVLFRQGDLTAERLGEQFRMLFGDSSQLQRMAAAMSRLGMSDAGERIAGICLESAKR